MFAKYEDSWPISFYCYHDFHRRRNIMAKSPDQKRRHSPRKCTVGSRPASPGTMIRNLKVTIIHPILHHELPLLTHCPILGGTREGE